MKLHATRLATARSRSSAPAAPHRLATAVPSHARPLGKTSAERAHPACSCGWRSWGPLWTQSPVRVARAAHARGRSAHLSGVLGALGALGAQGRAVAGAGASHLARECEAG